jgi:phospholipase D1/2
VSLEHFKKGPMSKYNDAEVSSKLRYPRDANREYMACIMGNEGIKQLRVVRTFLQNSDVQIIGSRKYKETYLKKRSGGRHKESCMRRCASCFRQWKKRYFVISSEGVMVSKKDFGEDAKVREMLLFDYNLRVQFGIRKTGIKNGTTISLTKGILIKSNTRDLYL